jgi:endonuclease/exonuclease/phosphatase family metal-dependent hydrolase
MARAFLLALWPATSMTSLSALDRAKRHAIATGPRDAATHARLLATLGFDGAINAGHGDAPTRGGDTLRVVAWNLERCKRVETSAELLRGLDADVLLLSEMDWGMARSGQRHTTRELAEQLGFSWAFGVEFLELDEPNEAERSEAGERARGPRSGPNEVGFHGNAILARGPLLQPRLVRLEARGDWFDGARGERRVGGRCAVLAQVERSGRAITFAAAHLDSHGSRENRAAELRVLLDAIDAYDATAPAVIGGDLNAFSLALAEIGDPARVAAALHEAPDRWSNPVPHEPLFAVAAECGYAWSSANVPGVATLRHAQPDGTSVRGAMKLDWFLVRGIEAHEPRVIAAVGADGRALSDHEAITIEARIGPGSPV